MSEQKHFSKNQVLISVTTPQGKIKYTNQHFVDIAEYSHEELIGKDHNIVRHPEMPKAAFKNLWQYIESGQSWMGPVKNLCKHGDYYWVNAFVTPITDSQGKVIEYQSIRTVLDKDVTSRAESVYKKVNQDPSYVEKLKPTDHTALLFWLLLSLTLLSGILLLDIVPAQWLTSLLFAGLITVTTGYHFWRKRFIKLTHKAQAIYNNPLMSHLYCGNNDALSSIDLALTKQKAELKAVIGRVNDASDKITTSANQCNELGSEVSETISDQKRQITEVSDAITELSNTINNISDVVIHTNQSSKQGMALSETSQSIVEQTIDSIKDFSSHITHINGTIENLIAGSHAIETVLNEINGIAEQTNLLALNAAIEAARAGEHGRGFSVVADEVRALSVRTQQSTEEVNKVLGKIQLESESAISAVAQGNALSGNCLTLASQTNESLLGISAEIRNLSHMSDQISSAVNQQVVVAEQVKLNMSEISTISQLSEDNGLASASLNNDLLRQIHHQQSLINQFSM